MRFALTADWHLRGERPRCRRDLDWIDTQRMMVRFIVDHCIDNKIPLFVGGDIFHTPRVSYECLNMSIAELWRQGLDLKILAGNHDLPYHNYDLLESSSIGVLSKFAEEINKKSKEKNKQDWLPGYIGNRCDTYAFKALSEIGTEINKTNLPEIQGQPFGRDDSENDAPIVFSHQLVFPNAEARPMGCKDLGRIPEEVLEQFPHADIVCVGDYHHKFVYTAPDGRMVINPGCTIRQVADMKDYKPSFYIVDTEARTVEEILIPDDYELVSDEHLTEAKEKSLSMSAFVEAVKNKGSVELDFKAKLETKLEACEDAPVKAFTVALMQETFNESK